MKHFYLLFFVLFAFTAIGQQSIIGTTFLGGTKSTGRCNSNEILIRAASAVDGCVTTKKFQFHAFNLSECTEISDIAMLKIYSTVSSDFDAHHSRASLECEAKVVDPYRFFCKYSLDRLTNGVDHYAPVAVADYPPMGRPLIKKYPVSVSTAVSLEVKEMKKVTITHIYRQKEKNINAGGKSVCHVDTAQFKLGVYVVKGVDSERNAVYGKFVVAERSCKDCSVGEVKV